jgi:hypothetical protein
VTSSGAWLTASLREARILIVDDEKLQRGHLARIVEQWGAGGAVGVRTEDEIDTRCGRRTG